MDIDDLAAKTTDLKQVRRAACRLSAILAIVGIALILVSSTWIGAAALIFAGLAAVMGCFVYPRIIKAADRQGTS